MTQIPITNETILFLIFRSWILFDICHLDFGFSKLRFEFTSAIYREKSDLPSDQCIPVDLRLQ